MVSPLLTTWPALGTRLQPLSLGALPTPVERLSELETRLGSGPLFVKRDDLSSPIYGGNKVRTLEVLFALARARNAHRIVATGAYGSNHAVATVLHAPAAGLEPSAVLFAQPISWAALENFRVSLAFASKLRAVGHWSLLPFGVLAAKEPGSVIMAPGGATPDGALGYVSAALELAHQVERGELPEPRAIVIGIGSTCTTAGLLVGFAHAVRLGIGFSAPPTLVAVRVTPWPVTSRFRILSLAVRASQRLAELASDASLSLSKTELGRSLEVDGRELGPGYGHASTSGREAIELFRTAGLFALDTTYSGKAAAGFLRRARVGAGGPTLFWSTKSTAPLPELGAADLERAPSRARRWILRAEAELAAVGELPPNYVRLEP